MINFKKYDYNTNKYPFRKLIEDLYNVQDLNKIHLTRSELLPEEKLNFNNEASTNFHKLFYNKLNNNWEEFIETYENFIRDEISKIIVEPFLYQYLPSYRLQLPQDQAIHKWHYDSDKDHKHPDGEINFCLAITQMKNTTAIWSESEPGIKDFKPLEIDYGEFFQFNGNKCTHGNKVNISENSRISLDFRILPFQKYYPEQNNISVSNKKKFEIGGYYKLFNKNI
jgi:ectoine hydroxylase-related dioxygenase (phytanoyl-CoA dioxygenase family)